MKYRLSTLLLVTLAIALALVVIRQHVIIGGLQDAVQREQWAVFVRDRELHAEYEQREYPPFNAKDFWFNLWKHYQRPTEPSNG